MTEASLTYLKQEFSRLKVEYNALQTKHRFMQRLQDIGDGNNEIAGNASIDNTLFKICNYKYWFSISRKPSRNQQRGGKSDARPCASTKGCGMLLIGGLHPL